ncbi:APC family permease [Brevibacillus fulvus]|uniref:Amino acid efflux transporter n=1 Tax=Brevibacillus fulvus TaxID=1125967 RepID=A0A938XX51_9BACL|nr:amino acid permease [Brevibacillus fulvus]MBM7589310.1 amino acid efflux transporter [Brevibacillus fulvus]
MSQGKQKQASLQKTLNLPQIVTLYVGAVVGSGILLIPGLAAEMAGPASLIAWLAMSVLVLPMAITMGLLSAKYPSSGGVSHFVRLAYGDRYGNIVGWFFLLSVPIGAPILAVTGTRYLGILLHWGDGQTFMLAGLLLLLVLLMNVFGLQLAGKIQTIVVSLIIVILLMAIATSIPHFDSGNFTPFLPDGWLSVVQTAGLLFWCFIGWEAVTHLSEEFVDPERDAIRGVLWSAGLVALLYFGTAFMTVATHSYGEQLSSTSLSVMIQLSLGPFGGWVVAVTALFICIATANAYVSAASRIALALAKQGIAPKWFGLIHGKYRTPIGGLLFLAICFAIVLTVLLTDTVSLAQLLNLPNATFFATYISGCLAGVRLLRENKSGLAAAWISLVVTICLYPFLGWSALYPLLVVVLVLVLDRKKTSAQR